MFEAYYSQLNTPCLVVDEPMTRENIKRMQQVADANGCTLRPHIKTHKTPYFAKLQQQLGARGITSCKVSEAEVMADAGLRDIFIAYPLVPYTSSAEPTLLPLLKFSKRRMAFPDVDAMVKT